MMASGEARRVRVAAKVLDDRRQRNAVAARRFCTHGHRQSGAGADLQKPDYASLNIYRLCVDGEGF